MLAGIGITGPLPYIPVLYIVIMSRPYGHGHGFQGKQQYIWLELNIQSNLYVSILYNSNLPISIAPAGPSLGLGMGEIAYLFNSMHSQSVVPNLVLPYY